MLRHEECRAAARAGTKPALSGLRLSRTMIAGRLVSDAAQGAVGRFDQPAGLHRRSECTRHRRHRSVAARGRSRLIGAAPEKITKPQDLGAPFALADGDEISSAIAGKGIERASKLALGQHRPEQERGQERRSGPGNDGRRSDFLARIIGREAQVAGIDAERREPAAPSAVGNERQLG